MENLSKENEKFIKSYIDDFCKTSAILEDVGACVGIFGSAIFTSDNKFYKSASELSRILAIAKFNVISGGSGGIMEAANRGAKEANSSESIGINIILPDEQIPNPYTTKETTVCSFSVRKHFLIKNLTSCVIFPGGFGTLDELFDILALVRTRSVLPISIHLYDTEFWAPMIDFFHKSLLKNKTISQKDLDMLHVSDSLEEIVSKIKTHLKNYIKIMQEFELENTKRFDLIKKQFQL